MHSMKEHWGEMVGEYLVAFGHLNEINYYIYKRFSFILLGFAAKNEAGGGGGGNRIPKNIKRSYCIKRIICHTNHVVVEEMVVA